MSFDVDQDILLGSKTMSSVVIPLRTQSGEPIGVIKAFNKLDMDTSNHSG